MTNFGLLFFDNLVTWQSGNLTIWQPDNLATLPCFRGSISNISISSSLSEKGFTFSLREMTVINRIVEKLFPFPDFPKKYLFSFSFDVLKMGCSKRDGTPLKWKIAKKKCVCVCRMGLGYSKEWRSHLVKSIDQWC